MGNSETSVTLELPDVKDLEETTGELICAADEISIDSPERYEFAAKFLRELKKHEKTIKERYSRYKKPAKEVYDRLREDEKTDLHEFQRAEGIVKPKMVEYVKAERLKREEDERKLREEAHKLEEERRLAQAAQAEAQGDNEKAEQILDKPIKAPPVIVADHTPKVSGVNIKKIWRYRIVDEDAVPREYCKADPGKINAEVRKLKGKAEIPGVEVFSEDSVAAG